MNRIPMSLKVASALAAISLTIACVCPDDTDPGGAGGYGGGPPPPNCEPSVTEPDGCAPGDAALIDACRAINIDAVPSLCPAEVADGCVPAGVEADGCTPIFCCAL